MVYKNQLDFIERTKEIIKQYEKGQIPKKEKYEVTLLLNCFVGLLIIPQQKWYDELPKDIVSEAEWGIDPANITIIKSASGSTEDKSVQNVARHLRNSIAHYHFVIPESNSREIESVKFEDFSDDKKTKQKTKQKTKIKTFETVMSIENIRRFTNGLTEFALRKIVPAGADL